MSRFAIAGVQMYVRYGVDNLAAMNEKLNAITRRFSWVDMVVFSELAPFGPSMAHAQPLPGPAENAFREMAAKHDIWLLPGSLFEKCGDNIYNTALVIDPQGTVVGRYRKMFPFRPYEAGVSAGTEFLTFGVSICYDMWFPETTRTLAAMGAEMILHPTLTDTIDRDVELAIARASAGTNQCFFLDVNGIGAGGVGRSVVVRPTGTVVHEAGSGEETIPLEVDLAVARRCRESGLFGLGQTLKSFRDREVDFDVYRPGGAGSDYLQGLGPLSLPKKRGRPEGDQT